MSVQKKKQKLTEDEIFKRAYSYYRKNDNNRALKLISKIDNQTNRFLELKAQVLYQAERYKESFNLFESLNNDDEFAEIRKANYFAAGSFADENVNILGEIDTEIESYEILYNKACFYISKDMYEKAAKLLDKASQKCREVLTEDGLSETDIQKELSLILAQKAFVFLNMGRENEAIKIYNCLKNSNISNPNVKVVVLNNLLIFENSSNNSNELSKTRFELIRALQKKRSKLSEFQKKAVKSNLKILKTTKAKTSMNNKTDNEAFQEIVTGKLFKRKRKRKTRLPKNFNPNVPPDPERWLPRQERSSYKKKLNRKYKDRDIGRGTQGSSTFANVQLPNTQTNTKNVKASSSVEQSPKPVNEGLRQQRLLAVKKNKKRKGGKW